MRSIAELTSMSMDFARTLAGRDYFRMRQPLGLFERDPRCYYSDLRGKVMWKGHFQDGVPALYVPRLRRHETLPVMVLHYGLGNMDCYFTTGDSVFLSNIGRVAEWILNNLNDKHYCANGVVARDAQKRYLSDNSAMAQGELLSFAVRAIRHELVSASLAMQLGARLNGVLTNMLAPVTEEGTTLNTGEDLFFCEFCTEDRLIVLNGWIFAVFGLFDFLQWSEHDIAKAALDRTLDTMVRHLPTFVCSNGWSFYDTKGRVCSPNYHFLHVQLLTALHRLCHRNELIRTAETFSAAYSATNRVRYTLRKVVEKLSDSEVYTTHSRSGN